jgi:ribosomal protein S6--L-glutamate ligase
MSQNKVFGSEEWCSFSKLGIPTIKARVDSGAKKSALHAIKHSPVYQKYQLGASLTSTIQNNLKTILHCKAR